MPQSQAMQNPHLPGGPGWAGTPWASDQGDLGSKGDLCYSGSPPVRARQGSLGIQAKLCYPTAV